MRFKAGAIGAAAGFAFAVVGVLFGFEMSSAGTMLSVVLGAMAGVLFLSEYL